MEEMNKTEGILLPEEEYRALPALSVKEPMAMAEEIAHILDCKKGHDIKVIRVEDKTSVPTFAILFINFTFNIFILSMVILYSYFPRCQERCANFFYFQ